jgi:hypothetical protein
LKIGFSSKNKHATTNAGWFMHDAHKSNKKARLSEEDGNDKLKSEEAIVINLCYWRKGGVIGSEHIRRYYFSHGWRFCWKN